MHEMKQFFVTFFGIGVITILLILIIPVLSPASQNPTKTYPDASTITEYSDNSEINSSRENDQNTEKTLDSKDLFTQDPSKQATSLPTPATSSTGAKPTSNEIITPNISSLLSGPINTQARSSLVNVICRVHTGRKIRTTTGSGIIIDQKGIVLTNAHVVYTYLLDKAYDAQSVSCTIRTGNPAKDKFKAVPLYISEMWIEKNAMKLSSENIYGTGEHDFAFLYINETIDGTPLPSSFSSLPINSQPLAINTGDEVLTIGYPAEFLRREDIERDLFLTSDNGFVDEFFTFTRTTPDMMTISGSILAQRGASGGAIVSKEGHLAGIVVTSTDSNVLTDRKLGAISLYYINRNLTEQTGRSIVELLLLNPQEASKRFEERTAPRLRNILQQAFTTN
jgi:hypothetical protein